MSKKDEQQQEEPKKGLFIDGVQTRILLDLEREYIKNNPTDFLFGRKQPKSDVKTSDKPINVKCSLCGTKIESKDFLFVCLECKKPVCGGCVPLYTKKGKFLCEECQ